MSSSAAMETGAIGAIGAAFGAAPAAAAAAPAPGLASAAAASSAAGPDVTVQTSSSGVRVAIVGCGHGELDKMFECVAALSARSGPIDLLLCCGDFQSVRNYEDLSCMACPQKYRQLNTFYKYYTGEKVAPVLTVFIGGNHEASNYLVELFHGGWVAPNIYYMGFSSVLEFGGLRIGGLSGIFNDRHFRQGHYEHAPFDNDSQRSVYHVREYDVWQLMQYQQAAAAAAASAAAAPSAASASAATPASPAAAGGPIDLFMSHDWPRNIAHHGNTAELIRRKKFLASEIADSSLGSPPAEQLLHHLKPRYWFSAHMHVKFPAVVRHKETSTCTQFLALDKCLPHREYMQILDFPNARGPKVLSYDPAWLAILKATHPFLSVQRHGRPLPAVASRGVPAAELAWVRANVPRGVGGLHTVPLNFTRTAPGWTEAMGHDTRGQARQPPFRIDPQTTAFLAMLQLPDVLTPAFAQGGQGAQRPSFQQQQGFQQQQSSGFPASPPIAHAAKKQRIEPAVHTNPEEIDLDALEMDEAAPATSSSHNPEEIPLDLDDEDDHHHHHRHDATCSHDAAPAASATAPSATAAHDEIALDD